LNAKCRSILARYMDTPKDAIIFNQRRTIRERVSERKAKRKTKITPSQEKRAKYQQVRREYLANEEYTRYSYRKAVVDACERAGIEKWTPYGKSHLLTSFLSLTVWGQVRHLSRQTFYPVTGVAYWHVRELPSCVKGQCKWFNLLFNESVTLQDLKSQNRPKTIKYLRRKILLLNDLHVKHCLHCMMRVQHFCTTHNNIC